ncbi:histamine H2 receptor-like [Lytechinus pictus]|uniref:histamine H2 receptor-like n=1 Tax=Lytechinus pictus TaxID=7653 RepID=UPI0030B9B4AE
MIPSTTNEVGNFTQPTVTTREPQDLIIDMIEICNILLAATSVFLNSSIIILVVCSPRLRKQHNIFTFNMAVIDIFSAFVMLISLAVFMTRKVPRILLTTWGSSIVSASLNILLLALYRYVTVQVDPFGIRNLVTTPRCILACVLTWLNGFLVHIFVIFDEGSTWVSSFILFFFALTGISYALIYRGVTSSRDVRRLKENRRLLITFVSIYITSVAFWIPGLALTIFYSENDLIEDICVLSLNANLIVNPVIFWARSNDFRTELKRLLFKTNIGPIMV